MTAGGRLSVCCGVPGGGEEEGGPGQSACRSPSDPLRKGWWAQGMPCAGPWSDRQAGGAGQARTVGSPGQESTPACPGGQVGPVLALGSSLPLLHTKGRAPQLAVYEMRTARKRISSMAGTEWAVGSALLHFCRAADAPSLPGMETSLLQVRGGSELQGASLSSLESGLPWAACDLPWVPFWGCICLAQSWPCCGAGPVEPGCVSLKPPRFSYLLTVCFLRCWEQTPPGAEWGLGCARVCGGCPRPPQSALSPSSSSFSCFLSLNPHPLQRKQASPTHPAAQKGGPCGDTWTGLAFRRNQGKLWAHPPPSRAGVATRSSAGVGNSQ